MMKGFIQTELSKLGAQSCETVELNIWPYFLFTLLKGATIELESAKILQKLTSYQLVYMLLFIILPHRREVCWSLVIKLKKIRSLEVLNSM